MMFSKIVGRICMHHMETVWQAGQSQFDRHLHQQQPLSFGCNVEYPRSHLPSPYSPIAASPRCVPLSRNLRVTSQFSGKITCLIVPALFWKR